MRPEIKQYPNSDELAIELEAQVADSVKEQDPRTTNKLFNAIQVALDHGVKEPTEEVLRTKLGAFYRCTNAGIAEFILRVRAADAELLLSFFAQLDNARTKAGDRDALRQQATDVPKETDDSNGTGGSTGFVDSNGSDASANFDSDSTEPPESPEAPEAIADDAGNDTYADTAPMLPDFPDFLIDPATGLPLTDPAEANKLTLDPVPSEANLLEAMNNTNYGSDGLTPPQRHLQGLMNLLKTNGRAPKGTKTAGLPSPEIFIITTLAELEGKAVQTGLTLHNQKYTPAQLRHALCIGGAMADASSPGAPCHRSTARSTMTTNGPSAEPPGSTTDGPCAAHTTTPDTPASSPLSGTPTGSIPSSCPSTLTRSKNHDATPIGAKPPTSCPCSEPCPLPGTDHP
ncbi:hypothetical protein ACIGB6_18160 [Paeniglutamicibacter gangotriensis]|uniref:hypothetical protein n=1 Tax=Paeniglutamicibacter gangotriensis TaxID=254787 RepID=UPI0037CC6E87